MLHTTPLRIKKQLNISSKLWSYLGVTIIVVFVAEMHRYFCHFCTSYQRYQHTLVSPNCVTRYLSVIF